MNYCEMIESLKKKFQELLLSLVVYLIQYIVEEKALVKVIQRTSDKLPKEKIDK